MKVRPKIDPPLTNSQESDICYIIGEWYLDWKINIAHYDTRTHILGFSIDDLKERLCDMSKNEKNEE